MISPVWLQIKPSVNRHLEMLGAHDIDASWVKDVKKKNNLVKMVPRLLFEEWSTKDLSSLFTNKEKLYKLVNFISDFIEEKGFDGIVLEIWSKFGGHYKGLVLFFVKYICIIYLYFIYLKF